MKVYELLEKLSKFNSDNDICVVVHNKCECFTIGYGGSDGSPINSKDNEIYIYVDKLNCMERKNENIC